MKTVLSIAGSDSSAGAGIQADLKTCSAIGVYCITVITAITAQNPAGLKLVEYVGKSMLEAQLDSIFESINPDAVKIGMLPNSDAVEIVARYLKKNKSKKIVIDPVLSATSGGSLTGGSKTERRQTIEKMILELFPLAELITPNLKEYKILSDSFNTLQLKEDNIAPNDNLSDLRSEYIEDIYDKLNVPILIKGGHSLDSPATDILYKPGQKPYSFTGNWIESRHTHGTGCTLSSAIASYLAKDYDLNESIKMAKQFVEKSISKGLNSNLYNDNGPLIQF